MIFRNPINIELLSGWLSGFHCETTVMKPWKLFVYACFVFLKWVVMPFFKNAFFWWNVYDSNFLHLLLHALKAKGLADLQTYTGNGRTGYSNAYGLVLLKPHNPSDTSWESSQHAHQSSGSKTDTANSCSAVRSSSIIKFTSTTTYSGPFKSGHFSIATSASLFLFRLCIQ